MLKNPIKLSLGVALLGATLYPATVQAMDPFRDMDPLKASFSSKTSRTWTSGKTTHTETSKTSWTHSSSATLITPEGRTYQGAAALERMGLPQPASAAAAFPAFFPIPPMGMMRPAPRPAPVAAAAAKRPAPRAVPVAAAPKPEDYEYRERAGMPEYRHRKPNGTYTAWKKI